MRMEVLVGDGRPVLRTTLTGPLAELVPDPVEEHPLVPVGRHGDCSRTGRPGSTTWCAGDVLRAADRRAVPALRGPRHTEGGLMDVLLLADYRDRW